MPLPHIANLDSHLEKHKKIDPVYKSLYEIHFDSTKDFETCYFNESAKKYYFRNNVNQKILEVWFNTNVILDTMKIMDCVGEELYISISIHDRGGKIIHKEVDEYVLYQYEFDQDWEANNEIVDVKCTFIKNKK